MAGMANWQAQISIDIDDLKKRIKVAEGELDKIEKKEHTVKLDIDTKTLENAVIKLDRMLESLGKGSGDFKEFENLSKQLSSITTDINNISKAFSVMNDGSDFTNSIKSIDTSLTALSNHFVSEMSGRMTSSIKEVKSTLSDIGDGGELAPLLQTINKIENAINELSTSVKGIGLNMNIDVGSDSEMEAKVQSKIVNALQAYQRLFDHIKMSSAGGQIITDKFFDFDINQYDTMMGKLQAYKKFIDNMRKEAKAQFNGQDVLYQDTEKGYWTQASAAMGQVTKAFNEMKSASDTNPLKDLFGSGDLSEVVSQLGLIVAKLEEISTTASSFKNVFANGFNITASVEEIDKLTNRVKELEDELAKIKLNPVNVDKSNISSGNSISVETYKQNAKAAEQETKAVQKLAEEKRKLRQQEKQSTQSSVDKALKDQVSAWKQIQSIREKIAKTDNADEINALQESKKYYQEQYNNANKILKANDGLYDKESQIAKLEQVRLETNAKIAGYKKDISLSSMESSLKSYQDKAFNLSIKPDEANRFAEYQAQLDSINKAIEDYKIHINSLQNKGVIDPSDIDEANRLKSIIEELLKNTKKFSSGDKGFTNIGADKVLEKINSILEQNSRMSKTAKDQIKAYYNEIYSGNPTRPLNEILDSVYKIVQQEREAGRAGKSWLEVFKDKKIYSFIGQAASMFSFYDLISLGREDFQTIRELDTALTEMRKVSSESISTLKEFQSVSFDIADTIGTTAKQIQNSTADWMRLGYSISEASALAENSNIYKNVGDMEINEATEHMVSSVQAWKSEFNDNVIETSEAVINRYNKIGNEFAISSADIGEAMETSAAALKAGGNSLNESLGLLTAGNIIQQDASTTSAALKILSLRIRGRVMPPCMVTYALCY